MSAPDQTCGKCGGLMKYDDARDALVCSACGTSPATKRFEMRGKVAKVEPERQLVFGWLSVAVDAAGQLVVDSDGETIDPAELEGAAYDFVLYSRTGGEMHSKVCPDCGRSFDMQEQRDVGNACPDCGVSLEARQAARLVESMVFTPEKQSALGIPPGVLPACAWWVGFRVDDPEVWSKVKLGEYEGFSIGGTADRVLTAA